MPHRESALHCELASDTGLGYALFMSNRGSTVFLFSSNCCGIMEE